MRTSDLLALAISGLLSASYLRLSDPPAKRLPALRLRCYVPLANHSHSHLIVQDYERGAPQWDDTNDQGIHWKLVECLAIYVQF